MSYLIVDKSCRTLLYINRFMFTSELYRRSIVLPLSEGALKRIRDDDVIQGLDVERIKLDDDDLFYRIWDAGVFRRFNQICGALVDEYEQEEVGRNLNKAGKVIRSEFASLDLDSDVVDFINSLSALCERAHKLKLPLVFVL